MLAPGRERIGTRIQSCCGLLRWVYAPLSTTVITASDPSASERAQACARPAAPAPTTSTSEVSCGLPMLSYLSICYPMQSHTGSVSGPLDMNPGRLSLCGVEPPETCHAIEEPEVQEQTGR